MLTYKGVSFRAEELPQDGQRIIHDIERGTVKANGRVFMFTDFADEVVGEIKNAAGLIFLYENGYRFVKV